MDNEDHSFVALIVFLLVCLAVLSVLLSALSVTSDGQSIPDAPSATPPYVCHIRSTSQTYPCSYQPSHPAGFFTFRKSWQDPPLRTNKQVFKSKLFWIGLGADFAAMSVACTHKGSGEEWGSEIPAVAAVQGLKYVSYRFLDAGFGPALDGYTTGHYIYSATK